MSQVIQVIVLNSDSLHKYYMYKKKYHLLTVNLNCPKKPLKSHKVPMPACVFTYAMGVRLQKIFFQVKLCKPRRLVGPLLHVRNVRQVAPVTTTCSYFAASYSYVISKLLGIWCKKISTCAQCPTTYPLVSGLLLAISGT